MLECLVSTIRPLLVLVLAGCSGGEPAAPHDPVPLGFCVSPEGGWIEGSLAYGQLQEAAFEGELTEVERGLPADGPCAERDYASWVGQATGADPEHGVITVASGDRWAVATAVPGGSLAALEGPVALDYAFLQGGFSPNVGHGVLSVGADWAVWVGDGGVPDEVVAPDGVAVARGAELGPERGDCGSWHDFVTEVTVDGSTKGLDVGQTADVGSATITVGANEAQDDNEGGCADWFVARVTVGGWNR